METLFFILGIASVVVIAIAIVAVVSIVKVTKLQTKTGNTIDRIFDQFEKVTRTNAYDYEQIYRRVDEVERHFTSQLDSRLDKLTSRTESQIGDLHRLYRDLIKISTNKK